MDVRVPPFLASARSAQREEELGLVLLDRCYEVRAVRLHGPAGY
jgi:hypothetical protein